MNSRRNTATFFICALAILTGQGVVCLAQDQAPDLGSLLTDSASKMVGASYPAHEVELQIGHFMLRISDGTVSPVLAGGRTVGYYFEGEGIFNYNSVDRAEEAVLNTVVKSATGMKPASIDRGVRLSSAVERAVVWADPDLMPPMEGEPGPAPQEGFNAHQKLFSRAWMSPPFHLYLQHLIDNPNADYAYVEIFAGGDRLVYMYDAVENRSERLYALRDIPFSLPHGALFPITLSEQMIERDRRAFPHPNYLLTDVTYALDAPMKGNARLGITETIVPQLAPQRIYRFDLFSAFYDSKASARPVHIKSVLDEDGKDIPFHHAKDSLIVVLPEAAAVGEPFKLKFAIEGDFLVRSDGDSCWMLPVGPWFPMPELNGQYYTVHSTIRVEKPFIAIAPGKTLSRVEDGDYNVVVNQIDKPVQFICAVGGKYGIREETKDGLTIRVASYGMRNKRAEETNLNLARKLIKFYEPWLGPFPFDEFNIIEINELGWGQAPPGTMFITREAFTPLLAQVWSQGVNHRFAHEIAHQYWGHVVKMGSYEEQWITESFAEYSSLFAVRQLRGEPACEKIKENWKTNAALSNEKSSIPLSGRLLGIGKKSAFDRRNLVYFKGAVVLQALHEEIGDKLFVSFLRNYQIGLEWRFGTTRDMITLLQKLTGKDFTPYFEDCFWGTKMPPKRIFKETGS